MDRPARRVHCLAGVSVGVAALGTLFNDTARGEVESALGGERGARVADALSSGEGPQALRSLPAAQQDAIARAAEQGFVAGLDAVMLAGALACLAGAALALVLVRDPDLVPGHEGLAPLPGAAASTPGSSAP